VIIPDAARTIALDDVRDAAQAIYEVAVRTPLVRVPWPDPPSPGSELYFKLELLQPIGSFKVRGAYNAVRQLPADALAGGLWTVSAGNAAQGVALAARHVGARCSVLVMDTAPQTKIRAIERLGATITRASHEECWRAVVERRSPRMQGHFIHPFDDDRFIAGNATLALEIVEDLPGVDTIVGAVGGGGLLSGVLAVVHSLRPAVRVFAAEPETASPLAASLAAGGPVAFDHWQPSFVDGAGGRSVVPTMWPLLRRVDGSLIVSLDEVRHAMRFAAEEARVIAEGAAGCAIAAALSGRAGGGKVVVIVSGGNIDLSRFAALTGACDNANPHS
jgi:threonine dehydratase